MNNKSDIKGSEHWACNATCKGGHQLVQIQSEVMSTDLPYCFVCFIFYRSFHKIPQDFQEMWSAWKQRPDMFSTLKYNTTPGVVHACLLRLGD